jgi:GNAT superfamily N-acetyltransferase
LPIPKLKTRFILEKIYFIKEWTGKGVGAQLIGLLCARRRIGARMRLARSDGHSRKPIALTKKLDFQHSRVCLSGEFELMKEEFRGMIVMKNCLIKNGN